MTEGSSQEGDQAVREALKTTWKISEEELEALVPQPKEGLTTIRKMQAVLLIVVKMLLSASSSSNLHFNPLLEHAPFHQDFFRRYKERKMIQRSGSGNMFEEQRNVISLT